MGPQDGLTTDDDVRIAFGSTSITSNVTTAQRQADKAQQWLSLLRRF